jgi:hypothetical protein
VASFNLDMSVETDAYKRLLFLSFLYVGDSDHYMMDMSDDVIIDTNYCLMSVL